MKISSAGLSIFMFMTLLFLSACGGGDGTAPPPDEPPQGSQNWDEMVWDRDNWT